MVVDQNQSGCPELERPLDDFAGINRRMIDRAALLPLVLDQCILAIEEEYMELLNFAVGNLRTAIVDQCVVRCYQRAAMQFCPHKPKRQLANQSDSGNCGHA